MHASISAHIAREYLLDEAAGRWGPNLPLFQERLGNEGRKEHVENLYFAYLFVLRAVRKAGPLLERAAFETGMPEADARTQALVSQLVRPTKICPGPKAGAPADSWTLRLSRCMLRGGILTSGHAFLPRKQQLTCTWWLCRC